MCPSQSQPCGAEKEPPPPIAEPSAASRLALCGYCQTWVSKPCGEGCCAQPSDPSWDELVAQRASVVEGAAVDARLYTAAPKMLEALKVCRSKFEEYAVSHYRKGSAEGDVKALANQRMATLCDDAIALTLGVSTARPADRPAMPRDTDNSNATGAAK